MIRVTSFTHWEKKLEIKNLRITQRLNDVEKDGTRSLNADSIT